MKNIFFYYYLALKNHNRKSQISENNFYDEIIVGLTAGARKISIVSFLDFKNMDSWQRASSATAAVSVGMPALQQRLLVLYASSATAAVSVACQQCNSSC